LMYEPNTTFLKDLDFPFKAVFVPHPVFFDTHFDPEELEEYLWIDDFMTFANEDFMRMSSYYYTSQASHKIYSDWKDGRGSSQCRRPSLIHPVKPRDLMGSY
jgi:hypothetical protein